MTTTPSPSRSAVSIESASRAASGSATGRPVSGSIGRPSASRSASSGASARRTTKRSTTTSMVWRLYLSRVGASDSSYCSPSTRTRTKPCLRAASKTRSPSVLRSLISGPRTSRRVPSGRARTWSTICCTGLALDLVAVGAMRVAGPGEQQPEVVVDLGDRADGRARVPAGALLVDRDGRAQPVDLVDVRLLHLAEELARVGAQALDVAPLAFGVDRVEGEAALAAAGQPGDDDQPVARERDVDVLEVVLARSANNDPILGHRQ